MTDIHSDRILIVDFGSQYTQLIARRVREANVYCEIMPYDADVEHDYSDFRDAHERRRIWPKND